MVGFFIRRFARWLTGDTSHSGVTLAYRQELKEQARLEKMRYNYRGIFESIEALPRDPRYGDCARVNTPATLAIYGCYGRRWELDRYNGGIHFVATVQERNLPATTKPGFGYFIQTDQGTSAKIFTGDEPDLWVDLGVASKEMMQSQYECALYREAMING